MKNSISILGFIKRNPKFSILNVRETYKYRKIMKQYSLEHPVCQFCGISGGRIDVHHKIPVSQAPELACDKSNLITLHRKPQCHLVVGHHGNWKDFNKNVEATCKTNSPNLN